MPISRLPDAAVRELGSTLAISTPVALVKELVDNAIDAGASFVDVIVSYNTVDRIEVRDNGHGIPLSDLNSLGRSGHTSKITTFDDLITLGGKSLGFRGVALASINTVAEVSLITRTAEEPVAVAFQVSRGGGIENSKHTSAPVGTTVLATKLFSRTPVREKLALKKFRENLAKMRELLRSYALARPQIKLQFRVVTGENTTACSYAPHPQANTKEVISQLFSTGLALNCVPHTFHGSQPHTPGEGAGAGVGLTFEAYLPHASADVNIIMGHGAFFSVDSRPVSPTRGTFKKLYTSFKAHLSRSIRVSSSGQNQALHAPFIQLDIRCAPGSYDPNIEPSKDDVLFRDEGYIINQFENLMSSIYPTAVDKPDEPTTLAVSTVSGREASQNGLTIVPEPGQNTQANCPSQPAALEVRSESGHRRSSAREKTIEVGGVALNPACPPAALSASTASGLLLPSMERAAKPRENTNHGNYATPPNTSSEIEDPAGQNHGHMRDPATRGGGEICSRTVGDSRADDRHTTPSGATLNIEGGMAGPRYPVNLHLTPRPSQILDTPSPKLVGVQNHDDFQPQSFVVDMSAPIGSSDDEDPLPHGSRPHTKPRRVGGRELGEVDDEEGGGNHLDGLNPWSIARLTAARRPPRQPLPQTVDQELETADIQVAPGGGGRRQLSTAQISPRQYRAANTISQSRRPPPFKSPGGPYKRPTITHVRGDASKGAKVQTTLERFRHINQPIVDTREGSQSPSPQTTPANDRSFPTRLPKEDPRGYLLRGQHTIANDMPNKLRRLKTELLPLEMTPLGSGTHTLRLTVNVSTSVIATLFEKISPLDGYSSDGKVERGLHDDIEPDEIDKLIAQADRSSRSYVQGIVPDISPLRVDTTHWQSVNYIAHII